MRNFRELKVWRDSIKLVPLVYSITKKMPISERWNLVNQMNRAAVSIPSNIAEGASRRTGVEFVRYLDIALGSSFELETQFIICKNLDYFEQKVLIELTQNINSLQCRINALRSSILELEEAKRKEQEKTKT